MTVVIVNGADLVDPRDPAGRTWRQINAAMTHKIPLGSLVEIDNGVRLFVVKHTRDCDQTPLYSLTANLDDLGEEPDPIAYMRWQSGYDEEGLTVVKPPQENGPGRQGRTAD